MPANDPSGLPPGQLLPLYPMTVADVLDGAFRSWRAVVGMATAIVLLVTGPLEIVRHLVTYRVAPEMMVGPVYLEDPALVDVGGLLLVMLLGLIASLAGVYASAAVLIVVVDADQGRATGLGAAFRAALRPAAMSLVALLLVGLAALAAIVVASVLLVVTVGIAGIVLLPVGFIAMAVLVAVGALSVPIAVTERTGPIATLGRAIWVLRVRFWRTVGITWLLLLVLSGIGLGVTFLLEVLAIAAGPGTWIVLALSQLVVTVVQLPVVSLAALLVLLDARMLQEGYDLEVRTSRLAVA